MISSKNFTVDARAKMMISDQDLINSPDSEITNKEQRWHTQHES